MCLAVEVSTRAPCVGVWGGGLLFFGLVVGPVLRFSFLLKLGFGPLLDFSCYGWIWFSWVFSFIIISVGKKKKMLVYTVIAFVCVCR